jgi:hypothetical protein
MCRGISPEEFVFDAPMAVKIAGQFNEGIVTFKEHQGKELWPELFSPVAAALLVVMVEGGHEQARSQLSTTKDRRGIDCAFSSRSNRCLLALRSKNASAARRLALFADGGGVKCGLKLEAGQSSLNTGDVE